MKLSPIVLFVYNRPDHTKKTVEALQKNELAKDSLLYVFSDGPKREEDVLKVNEIREYLKTIKGFKKVEIFESDKNKGLANSVISGVTKIINKHGRVIVLEDDIITPPNYLFFMNFLLNKYKNNNKIYSITGYNPPAKLMKIPRNYLYDVYFNLRAGAQTWGTWEDRWEKVDWEIKDFENFKKNKDLQKKFNLGGDDMSEMLINQMEGKLDSWAIRWCYHHFKNNAFCIYPVKSFINNIGYDGSGVHSGNVKNIYSNNILNQIKKPKIPDKIEINENILRNFRKVHKKNYIKQGIINCLKIAGLYELYRKIRYKR